MTQYAFQVKKCSQKECDYSLENPPSLPSDMFASVHPLLEGNTEKYLTA